jgi:hypothetical protein
MENTYYQEMISLQNQLKNANNKIGELEKIIEDLKNNITKLNHLSYIRINNNHGWQRIKNSENKKI